MLIKLIKEIVAVIKIVVGQVKNNYIDLKIIFLSGSAFEPRVNSRGESLAGAFTLGTYSRGISKVNGA